MSSKIRELCKDFCGYSTLHGLHFLFDSPWTIRRAIWSLLLLTATFWFFYQAHGALMKWRKFEVYITTKIKREKDLDFPTVTVCNKNMLKKSKIIGKDGQLWLDGQNNQLKKEWPEIHSKINASFDIGKELLMNGHRAHDVIKGVKFDNSCPGTLNMTTTTFLTGMFGLCHTIHIKNKVHKLGESFGLTLMLDSEPHEYYGKNSWDGSGFRLMVHEPGTIPEMDKYGIDIPTGFKTNLRVQKKKRVHLPHPYPAKCGTKKLKSTNVYSENRCRAEENSNVIGENCGCRMLGLPVIKEEYSRFCNIVEMMTCAYPTYYMTFTSECPVQCSSVTYGTHSSLIVYPSKSVFRDSENKIKKIRICGVTHELEREFNNSRIDDESYFDWFRGRYAMVNVFFASKDVAVTQEMPVFDALDFAGNLGGNMGLYLGCSVLTLVEFVDLLALVFIHWFKKKKNKISQRDSATTTSSTRHPQQQ